MGNNDLGALSGPRPSLTLALCVAMALGGSFAPLCRGDEPSAPTETFKNTPQARAAEKIKHHEPDFSAKKRMGKASFYAKQFAGRPMADGAPMDPQGANAA